MPIASARVRFIAPSHNVNMSHDEAEYADVGVPASTGCGLVAGKVHRALSRSSPPLCTAAKTLCANAGRRAASFNHLIRAEEQGGRKRKAERLGGLQVDDQLEAGGYKLVP